MHLNRGLVISSSGENLALFDRDGGVALNDLRIDAAHRFNAEGQRRDVKQQQALHLTAKHARLERRADGNALIGVDALKGLFAHKLLDGFLHRRDAGGSAHHQNLVDFTGFQA